MYIHMYIADIRMIVQYRGLRATSTGLAVTDSLINELLLTNKQGLLLCDTSEL